jgi:hypothetical protein
MFAVQIDFFVTDRFHLPSAQPAGSSAAGTSGPGAAATFGTDPQQDRDAGWHMMADFTKQLDDLKVGMGVDSDVAGAAQKLSIAVIQVAAVLHVLEHGLCFPGFPQQADAQPALVIPAWAVKSGIAFCNLSFLQKLITLGLWRELAMKPYRVLSCRCWP